MKHCTSWAGSLTSRQQRLLHSDWAIPWAASQFREKTKILVLVCTSGENAASELGGGVVASVADVAVVAVVAYEPNPELSVAIKKWRAAFATLTVGHFSHSNFLGSLELACGEVATTPSQHGPSNHIVRLRDASKSLDHCFTRLQQQKTAAATEDCSSSSSRRRMQQQQKTAAAAAAEDCSSSRRRMQQQQKTAAAAAAAEDCSSSKRLQQKKKTAAAAEDCSSSRRLQQQQQQQQQKTAAAAAEDCSSSSRRLQQQKKTAAAEDCSSSRRLQQQKTAVWTRPWTRPERDLNETLVQVHTTPTQHPTTKEIMQDAPDKPEGKALNKVWGGSKQRHDKRTRCEQGRSTKPCLNSSLRNM